MYFCFMEDVLGLLFMYIDFQGSTRSQRPQGEHSLAKPL
jgi:hypothetical protein